MGTSIQNLYNWLITPDSEIASMETFNKSLIERAMDAHDASYTPKDNGGTTSYYDLPRPSLKELTETLLNEIHDKTDAEYMASLILKMFPSTLNDLIEFKEMKPFQHEIFKACYALKERALKGDASIERELNKIQYYLDRGKDLNFHKKL